MFCPNCGTQNADNVAFCAGCGTKLGADQPVQQLVSEVPVYEAPAQPQQPAYQQPVYQTPAQPQQPVYQQPYQPAYQQPSVVPGKGMGIASMVLGIVALVFYCIPYLPIVCAVIGVALGGVGLKKAKDVGMKNGMAVAGLVCSIIALGLGIYSVIAVYSAVNSAMDMFSAYGIY